MNEQGLRYPGTSNLDVATTTEVVRYAMKFLSEIYNISISRLHSPVYAALQLWDRYPYGAGWHLWRPGYNWKEVGLVEFASKFAPKCLNWCIYQQLFIRKHSHFDQSYLGELVVTL